jgi:hypothetical protein
LINTICENSLIAAYARRSTTVSPEIVGYIAKEFRLHLVPSPDLEKEVPRNTTEVQRAMNVLLDLFAALEDKSQSAQTQVRL